VNELADSVLGIAALGAVNDRTLTEKSSHLQDAPMDFMKRRMDARTDEQSRSGSEVADPTSETMQSRRRSPTATTVPSEDLPLVISQSASQISSIMNPPPARSRQLPSPPGRSLPSPTSANVPSPSTGSYGSNPQSISLPPPGSLHQSTFLPPFGSAHSSDALQAHSAALQHEVSVQKIALSSLQGEHDKLLAAFSRSQTRASALEKKHAVSDSEIISLTEEKLRLQSQVLELERDIEELTRSRDGFRQAAVQESAQYVEIVKKASQLEIMAGEERKNWNKQKAEMELRIKAMSKETDTVMAGTHSSTVDSSTHIHDVNTPASSTNANETMKVEPTNDLVPIPIVFQQDQNDDLREEIRQLRRRCAEAEDALRTIRDDSNNMEGVLQALGLARKSISERADRALMDICTD
jgi:hypothetical protein